MLRRLTSEDKNKEKLNDKLWSQLRMNGYGKERNKDRIGKRRKTNECINVK